MLSCLKSQLLVFQWQGTIQAVNVIEHGLGWINAYVVADNVDPALYILTNLRNIVVTGLLPSFALSNLEKSFFAHNNVTILSNGTVGISDAGYNSGSFLIGLRLLCCKFELEHCID